MALVLRRPPFFRFPQLQHPPAMVTYLGTRDIAMFSTDLDSFDFKASTPEKIVKTVMTKLNKRRKASSCCTISRSTPAKPCRRCSRG
ncbi:MAG: hypothetical protein QOJ86_3767 [Bradyrhizobium sp.]|jgi:hypothetical protein|nr:hypothetical protein [Bradyrhizobium sp.]